MRSAGQRNNRKREEQYYLAMLSAGKIASTLVLVEGFMESAPQLILQSYILAKVDTPASNYTMPGTPGHGKQ